MAWIKIQKNGDAPQNGEYVFVVNKKGTACLAQYKDFGFRDACGFKFKSVQYWIQLPPHHPNKQHDEL